MATRTYGQFCGLAKALDLLGERWTLLVVRELALGPRRYRDLLGALPGVGTNLLAARLRTLEEHGVVGRVTLPPPAGVAAYALTPRGEALKPALDGLALWGAGLMDPEPQDEAVRASWAALSMRAGARPERLQGLEVTVAFAVEDERFYLRAHGGELSLRDGVPSEVPDASVRAGRTGFFALADRRLTPAQAVAAELVEIDGDRAAVARLLKVAHLPPRG